MSRGAVLSVQPATPAMSTSPNVESAFCIGVPPRGTDRNGSPDERATPVPSVERFFRCGRDGRILRHGNDFRAKERKKEPPPGGDPGGGAVCATDSGVWRALHRLNKSDTGQCRRDLSLDIPQCWPTSRLTGVLKTPGDGSLCVRTADRVRMAVLPRAVPPSHGGFRSPVLEA